MITRTAVLPLCTFLSVIGVILEYTQKHTVSHTLVNGYKGLFPAYRLLRSRERDH